MLNLLNRSRAKNALDEKENRVRDWKIVSAGLMTLLIIQGAISFSKQNDITVHVPPDLSNGAAIKPGEVPKSSIYLFASEVWRSINYWPTNGDKDMPNNLEIYRCYMSDLVKQSQMNLHQARVKEGQANGRTRRMSAITDLKNVNSSVINIGAGTWDVDLDLRLEESQQNTVVKNELLRYRLRVAADNSGSTCNPFNLRVIGVDQPRKIEIQGLTAGAIK